MAAMLNLLSDYTAGWAYLTVRMYEKEPICF